MTRGAQAARGSGRGGASSTSRTNTKRSAPVDSDYEDTAAPKPKKVKAPKPLIEPHAPSGRKRTTDHPGEPDKRKVYRTHQEVQAERDQIAAAADERECRRRKLIAQIAALDTQGDKDAAEEDANAILTLDDLPKAPLDDVEQDGETLTITESDFEHIDDDNAYRSQNEFESAKKAKAPTKKKKKPKKGETRGEIEALAKALVDKNKAKAKGDVAGPKKALQNSDAAAASKKAGLSQVFLVCSAKAPQAAVSPGKQETGGLTDEDANSARPDFDEHTAKPKRINELVIIGGSSDTEDTPSRVPGPAIHPVPSLAQPPSKTPTTNKRVKSESSSAFTPNASADVKGLPALVGPTWDTHYLPTAYRALYCSADPMMFAAMGNTPTSQTMAVNAVQAILDAVHPGHTLPNVVWGDKVCKKTVERIRERRSLIAQTGLKVVDETFKGEDYIHQPVAIRTYTKYAARFDGPGFWKEPTPESSPRDPKAPGYIKGSGYLESVMIIQTVAPFLKNEGFSLPDAGVDGTYDFSGMPRGLFALAAAGVEHGLNLYKATGTREPVPKFTRSAVSTAVAAYSRNIGRFTVSRWDSLLTAAGVSTAGAALAASEDLPMHDALRDDMYIPSSP
ncbi:hypothetical protein B0H10DRAFT_2438604 [Mycena sp. CBHHK59/15]|nr:hypothetical protein B0H10DRAFT_2438604 [Mycena sp. CBHHK59/15]